MGIVAKYVACSLACRSGRPQCEEIKRKPGQQSQESAKVCKVNRLSDPIESTEQRHRGTVDRGDSV